MPTFGSKFRRKPIAIDAMQWFPETGMDPLFDILPRDHISRVDDNHLTLRLATGHPVRVASGYWILSREGTFIDAMPDKMFRDRYEAVEN